MKRSRKLVSHLVVAAGVVFLASPPIEHIVLSKSALLLAPQPVSILAFGDMMLDRSVREYIEINGSSYPFAKIAPMLKGHDIVVANAEGTFGERPSVSVVNHSILSFTFATSTLPTLRQLGFSVFSQANNHGLDFGWSALAESKQWIEQNGISSFGDPENENPGPLYKSVRGEKVAFVGYSQFSEDGGTTQKVVNAIKEAHEAGAFTVVYPHWGVEYSLGITATQKMLAHKFIDAGADVIVGSHPHVVEPYEIYNGKAIFYSLGNFIFDQSWNDSVKKGRAVEIWLRPTSVSYTLWPITIEERQATPAATPETSFMLTR